MTFQVTNPDNRTDAGALELAGADSIVSADVGGFTYVFVAGGTDDGVSVFRLNANGTLTSVTNVTDDATLKLDGARGLSTGMVEGNTYLFAAGQVDNGVSVFRVGTDGSLTNVANVTDNGTLFLSGVTDTASARVGASSYLFTAGTADNGVSIFRVAGNGALTNVGNVADTGTLKLAGVDALTTVSVGGTSFLVAAGGVDNGISVFSIAANGTLANTNNFSDDATLKLAGASDVTTAVIGGVTYVFVAGAADNGVSVFSLNSSGILTNISNVTNSASTLFAGASSLSVTTIGQSTYLLVGGNENGLSMFRVENGSNSGVAAGSLTFIDNIADNGTRDLAGSTSVGSAGIGGTNYMLGAGTTDNGVSSFGSAATGQLYFFGQGGNPADERLAFVNNDGGNQTAFVDNNPTADLVTNSPASLGVDTAAGFYFAIVNSGNFGENASLVRGSLNGGAVTSLFTYPGPDGILGSNNDDDTIVNAMQIDVINHKIYVGEQWFDGGTPGSTGIRQYTYNPTNGVVTDNGFLVTVTSSGKPQESGFDILDPHDFALDTATGKLFFTEKLASQNGPNIEGIWRVDGPNAVSQVVSQAQFPDSGASGYFADVEVDRSTGLLYFDIQSQKAFGNVGYNAGQNNIWWIAETATGGIATALNFTGGIPAGHFYPDNMKFDQATRQLYVESEETDTGGAVVDDVIYVFQLDASGHTASLINTISLTPQFTQDQANIGGMTFNDIPALTGIAGTGIHAGEQGGAITLLTAPPTITDIDGDHLSSATVQITGGLFSSNESNATDDHLQVTAAGLAGTSIVASYNAATGTLTLSGYDTLAHYQQALAGVQYFTTGDNPTNYGLDTTRTLTWTVSDGALGVPGGSQNSATTSITIDAVNDTPVNTVPGAQTTNEDVAKAITGISIADPDANPGITNITVTLSVLHGTLTLLTNVAGGLTAGELANNGTATVTVTATLDEINATLANATGLTYASIADYNGSDTLHILTNDGGNTGSGGALTDADDISITITPVVDIANDTLSFNEDSGTHTLAMPNNDTFENTDRAITSVTQGLHGTVTINDNGTLGTNTDDFIVYTQVADYNGSDSFTYTVTSGGVTETATVNVTATAVADIVADTSTIIEDNGPTTLDLLANDSFENAGRFISAVTQGAHGSVSINNNGTAGDPTDDFVVYTPNADYNGTDSFTYTVTSPAGVTETASVTMTITAVADIVADSVSVAEDSGANTLDLLANDNFESAARFISAVTQGAHGSVAINNNGTPGNTADDFVVYTVTDANYNGPDSFNYTVTSGGVTETATVSVTLTPVNDTPAFSGLDGTPTFTEGGAGAVLDNNATITDIDLTATNYSGATLTLARSGAASAQDVFGTSGTLSFSGANVLIGVTTIGTFTQSGGTLAITFNASATQAAVNSTLQQLTYSNNSDNPPASAVIAYVFSDGNSGAQGPGGPLTANGSATVTITPTNDAPTATVPGSVGTATEQTAFSIKNAGLSVGDIDGNSGSETVTLSVGQGVLTVTAGTSGAGVSGSGTGTVTITGTIAQINALLNTDGTSTVSYFNSSDAPAASTSLSLTIHDNGATGGGDLSGSASGSISITAVNDGPVNTVPGTQTIGEDATRTFSGTISVADVDAGAGNLTVTLSVAHGTLTLNGIAGLDFTGGTGDGTADPTMTFSGTAGAINTALNGLVYTPTGDYNGSDTLSITTNDNGNTGTPGALQDVDTVTININAVADIVNDSVLATEDTPATLDLLANDSFENAGRFISAVTQGAHGTVSIDDNGTAGDPTDDFVVYTPDADYNGADSFTYTVTSGGVTETATVNVTVSAVADIADDSQTTAEDTAVDVHVLGNDNFEATPAITNVGAAAHGTAVLNDNATPGDTTDDFIVYTPNADYNGADSFTYTVTSGGATETATVNMTVTAVADIVDDSVTVLQDSGSNSLNLLANDNFESAARFISAVGAALHGTTAINNNGTAGDPTDDFVVYTPTGGYSGPDGFTYTVTSGGVTETANVTVNVGPPDAAPVVDLDTGTAGIDATATFVEGGGAVALGPTIDVSDADPGDMIHGATIAISDPEAGDILIANLPFPGGITIDVGSSTADFLVLTGTASAADYATALGQIGFDSSSDDPTVGGSHTSRSIGVTVNDGVLNSNPATSTVTVIGVDDPAVAHDDAVSTNEATALNGNVFSANGPGGVADSDPDNPLSVSAVNGSGANVGTQITLASGALLTLNADGTFAYDPNHAFDATPAAGSGASNTPAHDSFTYTLTGGDTATVSVTVTGIDTNDTLLGTAGPDTLNGGTGADTMSGGPGDDIYYVDNPGDVVNEADNQGFDTVYALTNYALTAGQHIELLSSFDIANQGALNLTGNEFDNIIVGTNGANTLSGGDGNDYLVGFAGDDTLFGGDGNDILFGGDGNDQLNGGAGNDVLFGDAGQNQMAGGTGDDTYYVHSGDVVIEADNEGTDTVYALTDYVLTAGAHVEFLSSVDIAHQGGLHLTGNEFDNVISGTLGADVLSGGGGSDILNGFGGDDTYIVDSMDDIVYEGVNDGNDTVYAVSDYALTAGQYIETLSAFSIAWTLDMNLTGNSADNLLVGTMGANILDGKEGNDYMVAFGGADSFAFTTSLDAVTNVDKIEGFEVGVDKILLDHAIFTSLGLGALDAGAFVVGAAAQDADDRIIYNSATAQLFYDADGNGAGAAVLFATMVGTPALHASDFTVI